MFKIISSINNLNYFYFKQILTDLIDSKLVGVYTKEDEQVLRITSEGKNAYILTKDVMPGILKLKADSIFKKEFSNIEEASSVVAEFTPKDEIYQDVYVVEKTETKAGWSEISPDEGWFLGYQHELDAFYKAADTGCHIESNSKLAADTIATIYSAYLSAERGGQETKVMNL